MKIQDLNKRIPNVVMQMTFLFSIISILTFIVFGKQVVADRFLETVAISFVLPLLFLLPFFKRLEAKSEGTT